MDPVDVEKTAFCTRGGGLFQRNVLPVWLTSTGATFQRLMERLRFGLHWETCLVYLDDIIIFAPDFDTHLVRLDAVLKRIAKAGLKISPDKCQLFQKQPEDPVISKVLVWAIAGEKPSWTNVKAEG